MNLRSFLLLMLPASAAAVIGTCEVRALKSSKVTLAHLQRKTVELQQELAASRRAYVLAEDNAAEARASASTATSPFVATGDAAFDAEGEDLLRRVYALRKRVDRNSDQWIPEIRHARDSDWLEAVTSVFPWSDASLPLAADSLRRSGQFAFLNSVQHALDRYLEQNNGMLPLSARDLIPFFPGPCDEASLTRYEIVARGHLRDVPKETPVLEEKMSPANQDSSDIVGINGLYVRLKPRNTDTADSQVDQRRSQAIFTAIEEYRKNHAGDWPTETQQLSPYVSDAAVLEGVKMEDHGYSTHDP